MMPGTGNGQLLVPPGFRFHPTDEELLYYYLRKKVSYEVIDLDVIREVDLNKLEPWDLKDKCRIGSGPQNEWYFFSHKDKKYPTGTRTNRATTAGFWKATGRDKAIHLSDSRIIGMRKTLVFYTGRAPHGQKTDWIMHEYRLDDDNNADSQEDGWVVCRVFKKKNHTRGYQQEIHQEDHHQIAHMRQAMEPKQNNHHLQYDYNLENSMHLPQLFSPDQPIIPPPPPPPPSFLSTMTNMDILECSQNLIKLTSSTLGGNGLINAHQDHHQRIQGDWSFLDKLLASSNNNNNNNNIHQSSLVMDHQQQQHLQAAGKCQPSSSSQMVHDNVENTSAAQNKYPFQYFGSEADFLKYSK